MANDEYYDSEEQDMWEGPPCPQCGNGPKYVGLLGTINWWICRACGWQYGTHHGTADQYVQEAK